MATPIGFAINRIRQRIPVEILELVFTPSKLFGSQRYAHNASTIDSQIKEKVIDGWVRMDTDSIGAQEVLIPIGDLPREPADKQGWILRIPRDRLNGRTIVQALSITVSPFGVAGNAFVGSNMLGGGTAMCGTSALGTLAQDVLNSAAPLELNQSTHIHLIGENTLFVEDNFPITNLSLRCKVSADAEFTFLKSPSYRDFGELCELACKAYIYNNYAIRLDEGYIRGGAEIGRVKDIIEGYSDAAQSYDEKIKEDWQAIVAMNDSYLHNRYVRGITNARQR